MAIRISIFYLRFVIVALVAVFSHLSHAGYFFNSGWVTPVGSCYETIAESCVATYVGASTPRHMTGATTGTLCNYVVDATGSPGTIGPSTCSTVCPVGQVRINAICVTPVQCVGGTVTSENTCSCPAGKTNNNGICEDDLPCDAQDQAAAQAAISPSWSHTTVVPLNNGFNTVNESVNDYDRCQNTCKVRVHATIKVGGITGASYTIVESGTESLAGGACENMTPSNAKVTGVNIGYGGEGTGCAAGFVYGSVNGVMGCHYVGTAPGGAGSTPSPGQGQAAGGAGTTTTTTTTTTNSDGTTSTSTSGGTSTNPVFGNGTNGSGIGCDPTDANYFKCQGLGDFKGEETDYSEAFGLDAMDTKIEDKKNEIVDAINNFKDQIGDELGISATGALPVYTTTVNGTTLRMDFAQYAQQLGIFASVIVFVSLVISAYIILRGS